MTTSHGRRIQGRRALAIMAWVSLVIVAGLLWYGQVEDVIRIQAWEPAALLLSAYSAFLAIFGWLLFAPERKSADESPALFFSGMLTLIPPCFIAYHLMPPSSPLRGWLTLGVFVFGLFAILSPLPAEVFAVPRDRKSYLQPLTDCYLSVLDVEEPKVDFQSLVPRSYYSLSTPDVARSPTPPSGPPRDPWADPFYGTGRSMSQVGSARRSTYSESRSRGADARPDAARLREPVDREKVRDIDYRAELDGDMKNRERAEQDLHDRSLPQSREPRRQSGLGYPAPSLTPPPLPPMPSALPADPTNSSPPRPSALARSAFAPRESRAPNYQPQTIPPLPSTSVTAVPGTNPSAASSVPTSVPTVPRRPLTERGERSTPAVGFQTPLTSRPVTSSPPPVPSYLGTSTERVSAPVSPTTLHAVPDQNRSVPTQVGPVAQPVTSLRLPRELPPEMSRELPPSIAESSLGSLAIAAAAPLTTASGYDDVLRSAVSEFRSISEPAPSASSTQATGLHELDRRIREEAAEDERETDAGGDSTVTPVMSLTAKTSPLNDVKMERLKDEVGGEMIEGTIRVFFEVGQKRAHLHVPFTPPLAGLPEVECEAVSDDSVRCKVAVRQPYGIRIEARRSDASSALHTDIGFAAVYTPSPRRG